MSTPVLTLRQFAGFYAPLAATSLLLTFTNPLLTGALSLTVNPATAFGGVRGGVFALWGAI